MFDCRLRSLAVLAALILCGFSNDPLSVAQDKTPALDRKDDVPQNADGAQKLVDAARAEAASEKKRADAATRMAERQRDRADWLEYAAQLGKAQREWNAGNSAVARELLAACQWNLRGWEYRYLHTLLNHRSQQSDPLLPIHAGAIGQVRSSGDGRLLVTSGIGHAIKLWDVRAADQLELRGTFECDGPPLMLQLSRDGKRLASLVRKPPSSDGDVITIWDVATRQPLATLAGHEKQIWRIALSPDGGQLATGDAGGLVKVRETPTGKLLREFKTTHGSAHVHDLAYSPDGRWLAFAGQDTTIRLWDCSDWREVHKLTPRAGDAVLSFSPDSTRLVSGNEDRSVQMWDVASGTELLTLRGHVGEVRNVTFSPDGRRVLGGSATTLHVWDAHLGQHLLTFTESVKGTSPAFIADGQAIVTGRADGQLQIRVADRGPNSVPLTGHSQTVNCVAYSPNGLFLATAGDDGKIKLRDANNGVELRTLNVTGGVTAIAFNADGTLLASGGVDKIVRLWDVETGVVRRMLQGHRGIPQAVAFRPDGKRLVSGGVDETVFVWDVATGETLTTWKADKQVLCLAYSPDGRRVASSGYDLNITIWNDATGERVSSLTGHTKLTLEVAFSPDGRWIASSGADSKVLLWNAATGESVPSPGGHEGYVYGLAFSADSRWLATAGMGRVVRVWDIATNRELVAFHGHLETVMGVAFHPNGRQLTSVGYGDRDGDSWGPGTARVWNIPPIDPLKPVEIKPE